MIYINDFMFTIAQCIRNIMQNDYLHVLSYEYLDSGQERKCTEMKQECELHLHQYSLYKIYSFSMMYLQLCNNQLAFEHNKLA